MLVPVEHRWARVDLLPREVLARRNLARTQKVLAVVLALAVLLVAGIWWVSAGSADRAAADVAAQQSRTAALQAQQAQYAEVPRVRAEVERVQQARAQAMAADVVWTRYLDEIGVRYPDGVWLSDLSVAVAPSSASTGLAAPATDPLADPAVATVSFTGTGGSYDDVAAWLDSLTEVPGFSDARYSVSTLTDLDGETVTTFTSTVGVTEAALSHRFDGKAAS
jgi:Tfp pilus assembly protein PilN